jgi:hypothetical protein
MKHLLAVAVIALIPVALTAQTQHFKFINDGEFAGVSASDAFSNFNLSVSRSTTNAGTTTNFSFLSFSFPQDSQSFTFTDIIGIIPNSAFTGVNTQNMALSLDTSTLDPSVFQEQCTFSFVDFSFVCQTPAPGTIQLSWSQNGALRDQIVALEHFQTFGTTTIHSHQRADTSSANVQGTVLGTTVSSTNGQVGINHLSTLEFTRN